MLKRGRKLLALVIAVLVLLSGKYCIDFIHKSIIAESSSHLEEIYTQINASFTALVSNNWNMLDDWKYHIGHTADESEGKLKEFLRNGKDNWNFTDFYFIGENGSYRSFLGREGFLDLGPQLETLIQDQEKIVVEGALSDGSQLTIFAIPVQKAMYRDLEYSAIAVGYNSMDLKRTLNINVFDQQSEYYVLRPDGRILFTTRDGKNQPSNFLEYLINNAKFIDSSAEQVSSGLIEGKSDVIRFKMMDTGYYMVYQPIGFQDWLTLWIVPEYMVNASMNHVQSMTSIIFMGFFAIVCTAELFYLVYRRKKAIQGKDVEIRYREKLFGMLTSNVDDIFVMFSADDFTVEYVSPNIERLLGVGMEEVKKDLRVLNAAIVDKTTIASKDVLRGIVMGESWQEDGEFIDLRTGKQHWYHQTIHYTSIGDKDKFIWVLSDRTKERQANQQLQQMLDIAQGANKAKSNFLANMSHDMRTPMNAVIGFATLLDRDAEDPDRVKEYAQKIMIASNHLLGLINNVLDMGKIESGKTSLNLSEFNFAVMLEELNTVMLPQARAKKQKFIIRTYGLYQELFIGDKVRISQILMNLLTNAVQYTPKGGEVELHIYNMEQVTKNYARLRFEVKDTGNGMGKEFMETVFDPFTREANTTASGIQGTGLGLAITKNLVDLMGGTIFVESVQGAGSTFTVDLELKISRQPEGGDFWKKHGIYSMLVVDGNEEVCVNIQNLMAGTSVYVQYALNGYTALDMIEKKQKQRNGYNLILLAWKMAEIDGIETARRIREKIGSHIPIFILTEYDWSEVEEEARGVGINAFLQKPFFISNFRQVIEQLGNGESYDRKEEKKNSGDGRTLSGLKFLVAEDNAINAEIISELLKTEGADCDIAENGQIALEMFENSEKGHYQMILMDIQMPVLDGYGAAMGIRGCRHPEAQTIPIAAMTANAFAEDVNKAMEAGMNAHMSKPVNMDLLKTTILQLI